MAALGSLAAALAKQAAIYAGTRLVDHGLDTAKTHLVAARQDAITWEIGERRSLTMQPDPASSDPDRVLVTVQSDGRPPMSLPVSVTASGEINFHFAQALGSGAAALASDVKLRAAVAESVRALALKLRGNDLDRPNLSELDESTDFQPDLPDQTGHNLDR
jgi:hypothetical protein